MFYPRAAFGLRSDTFMLRSRSANTTVELNRRWFRTFSVFVFAKYKEKTANNRQ